MIRSFLSIVLAALAGWLSAQPFGNEWIDHGKRYWALKIAAEGIHRVDSTTLANAGFPLGTVDPRTIQVFGKQRQVPIHLEGQDDGAFNSTDFIEFYANRNDAWLDSTLWDDPAHISNPFYSLYNDTIRYFITWAASPAEVLRIRPTASGNYAVHPARPYVFRTERQLFPDLYQGGKRTPEGAADARICEAEGYFWSQALNSPNGFVFLDFGFGGLLPYQGADAPSATYEMVIASANDPGDGSCPNHHLQLTSGAEILGDTVFMGYQLNHFTVSRTATSLTGGVLPIRIAAPHDLSCPGLPPDYPDAHVIAWQGFRYAAVPDLTLSLMISVEVPGDASGDSIHFAFKYAETPILHASGPSGTVRVQCVYDGLDWHAMLPPNAGITRVHLCRASVVLNETGLYPVNGTGQFVDHSTGLTDSAMVIVTHPLLRAAVGQYATYRATNPHNPYNTIIGDVEDLYMQFGGGVRMHPLAIKRYLRYVYTHAPTPPKALFLVGKSVKSTATFPPIGQFAGYRIDPIATEACLVPTMGSPSSDQLYGIDLLGGHPDQLTVPVGRLAARTPADVQNYLGKVQALEAQAPAKWMKNILHFRGGFNQSEWTTFDAALESYRHYAEDTCFSGRVIKFVKNGPGVIEQASADSVADLINEGVTLMTIFAHAYGGGFDITPITNPSDYQWNGRYPVLIGNSCYTGNVHLLDAASSSEQFVMPANAGVIAFLSSVDVGLSNYLQAYTEHFYKSFSQVNYGKSIGEHLRYAVEQQLQDQSLLSVNSAQTMTLHGDPTLVMNSPAMPDMEITDADVQFLPSPVTADVDSFEVRATVRNIGRGSYVPFSVALQRTLVEEGQTLPPLIQQLSLPHFQDTVVFTLPTAVMGGAGQGLNDLQVRVDEDPVLIVESNEQNNSTTRRMPIISGDLLPIDPYDFAITPDPAPLLQASTGDPFAAPRNYIFQIDTTDLFNSPVMEQATVNAPGGVVEWQPLGIYALNTTHDSLVFYWRCTLDSAGSGQYNWHESSFQHIPDRRGWGQAHYFQFKKDAFSNVIYDRPQREFDFYTGLRPIGCVNWGSSFDQTYWTKDLEIQEGQGCSDKPAFMVAVVDPFDFSPWKSRYNGQGRYYGNVNDNGNCRLRQEKYFIFRPINPVQMAGMANMLDNEIPDGHFVLIYTYLNLRRNLVDTSVVVPALEAIGAHRLVDGTVPDNVPYIFFCKKGDPTSYAEVWGETATAHIDTTIFVQVVGHSGSMGTNRTSTATAWSGLSWRSVPQQTYDDIRMNVIGVPPSGIEQPLLQFPAFGDDIDIQAFVPAAQYPQLKLRAELWNDSVAEPTPAQFSRWQLLGTPAPECAIDPPSGYYAAVDSAFQGQDAAVMVAINNVSEMPMDSLLVAAWVIGADNVKHLVHYEYGPPLAAGAILQDTILFNTEAYPGTNTLIIEANPVDTVTGVYDQPEQFHFNNIATLRFLTIQDRENPVLDVTFDGIHILDGDIVSAKPEVQMTLDDENTALILDSPADTAYFKVSLVDSSGTSQRVYFHQGGQDVLQFVPATGPANVCKVLYRPDLTQDGIYQLVVHATDISRNNSGDNDYKVRFEVINRPTITEVLNYPNPFTTNTRFVFTLTGHETPSAMRIQIMTISGRVVREVSMAELGPMRVGRNITEFAWDGTDQFGDRLARGVYLYRVMAQLHGEDIEYRETSAGSFFTKGFGKMYLLR